MRKVTAIAVALSLVGATSLMPNVIGSAANAADLTVPAKPNAGKKAAAAKPKPKKKQAYERSN
jgi:hypothetical protein